MPATKILTRMPDAPERRAALRMTGRYLITIEDGAHSEVSAKLSKAGFKAAPPLPAKATAAKAMPAGAHISLPNIGVALVDPAGRDDKLHSLAAEERAIIALEPERIVRAVGNAGAADYARA
jgi:hypothetical protein